MDKSQAFLTNNIDVRLNGKFTPTAATVTLGGGVLGAGRSVAAAQGLTGDPYLSTAATIAVPSSAWSVCEDSSTYCWEDVKPLPTVP